MNNDEWNATAVQLVAMWEEKNKKREGARNDFESFRLEMNDAIAARLEDSKALQGAEFLFLSTLHSSVKMFAEGWELGELSGMAVYLKLVSIMIGPASLFESMGGLSLTIPVVFMDEFAERFGVLYDVGSIDGDILISQANLDNAKVVKRVLLRHAVD